mmetsp:Transcript_18127/g.41121  ORF Transcript_18127/g.41121 Transcript_18127/m.41121 type:complete len:626 (-) Transcript_18127:497-2374(-)
MDANHERLDMSISALEYLLLVLESKFSFHNSYPNYKVPPTWFGRSMQAPDTGNLIVEYPPQCILLQDIHTPHIFVPPFDMFPDQALDLLSLEEIISKVALDKNRDGLFFWTIRTKMSPAQSSWFDCSLKRILLILNDMSEIYHGDQRISFLLARVQILLGNISDSCRLLESICTSETSDRAFLNSARYFLSQLRLIQLCADCQKMLHVDQSEQFCGIRSLLVEILQSNPQHVGALAGMAYLCFITPTARDDFQHTKNLLGKVFLIENDHEGCLIMQGIISIMEQNYDKAELYLCKSISKYTGHGGRLNPCAILGLAQVAKARNSDPKVMEMLYEVVWNDNNNCYPAAFNLAIVLVERGVTKGNRHDCRRAYDILLEMSNKPMMRHAGVLCLLGKLMSLQPNRDLITAQDFLRKALELNPSHCDSKVNLARCIMLSRTSAYPQPAHISLAFQKIASEISQIWSDDISEAECLLKEVLILYPNNVESILLLSQLKVNYQENFDEAKDRLTQLLDLEPSNYQGLYLKAQVMFKFKEFEAAEACLLAAIQNVPSDVSILREIVRILLDMGKGKAGIELCKKILSCDEVDAETFYFCSTTFARYGYYEDAFFARQMGDRSNIKCSLDTDF